MYDDDDDDSRFVELERSVTYNQWTSPSPYSILLHSNKVYATLLWKLVER